ncbi:prephenate dehydrogenase [Buchananella hordeovulneris]|uniref:prephenate dehydrogenase n=1 Tax=Buchananella hordeovulneris TaxID=52770 RepID=UPI0026DDA748|nr:prephenate dehydrogenase [Buchananella hordeovulneris]MDO5079729.1 prephenate dehydrogenase [Buchananella hordeovulneris]
MTARLTSGPVLIIGTGLLGTSIGLALQPEVPVQLRDISPAGAALARDLGAGSLASPHAPPPHLVVVATPPDVTGAVVVAALAEFPTAIITDVASVKHDIVTEVLTRAPAHAHRYVGSHPMAGRERAGAVGADAALFVGRPWVVVPHPASSDTAINAVRALAVDVGAILHVLPAAEHDAAVAVISHVPQVISSLLAARLAHAEPAALALAGQGLRDTTRIAASDPRLWTAILALNSREVSHVLRELQADLDTLVRALAAAAATSPASPGTHGAINAVLAAGNLGVARIPGKHGGGRTHYGKLTVLVPDQPGQLGRLFSDAGQAGISIEDVQLEHASGKSMGLVLLSVLPAQVEPLAAALTERGWQILETEV